MCLRGSHASGASPFTVDGGYIGPPVYGKSQLELDIPITYLESLCINPKP